MHATAAVKVYLLTHTIAYASFSEENRNEPEKSSRALSQIGRPWSWVCDLVGLRREIVVVIDELWCSASCQ